MAKPEKTEGCKCADLADTELRGKYGCKLRREFMIAVKAGKGSATLSPPVLAVEKIGKGRTKLPTIFCTYCPICGNKYPETSE